MSYEFKTKRQLLDKFISYTETPDNDNVRFKRKIKKELLKCPEILYLLHNKDYENELFSQDGLLNEDGEWDKYFGDNIRTSSSQKRSQKLKISCAIRHLLKRFLFIIP